MKRDILFILICWLLGWSPGVAQQRKMADVQHLADSILNRPTRWGSKAKARIAKTERVFAASELLSSVHDDAFYVCDAGTGFAVISADERMTPILGFSQSDSFDPDNIPPGMRELLECYAKEYEALMNGSPQRFVRRHIDNVQEQVGPLFTTQWGQNEPYNNRCPELEEERCLTGCVAVSSAQIMYYYQFPHVGTGWIEYKTRTNGIEIQEDLSTIILDWHYTLDYYYGGAPEESVNAIADVMYACAIAAQMDFGLKESSSNSYNQVKALVENFGYDPDISDIKKNCMTTNEWQTIMVKELNNERPIAYTASSPTAGGHSFIIDGYKADEDAYPYYHINWGWKGYLDNYFKLSSMEADDYDFTQNHTAVINIKPDNEERDAEFFWQAELAILSSARVNPDETHDVTLTMKNVVNHSYKTFSGKMEFYIKDDQDEETLIGTFNTPSEIPFNYGYATVNIKGTLPDNIAEGVYTVVIYSQANDSDIKKKITYPSPITLTVTTVTESYTPEIMITSLLNVGEDLDDLSVSLRAERPMNFATKPFTGILSMAVADDEGNILDKFGTVAPITNLQRYGYQNVAYTFIGKLPDYLEDGKYRLLLAANQSGYQEWGAVTEFKMEGGKIVSYGKDSYIPFWLEDGKIIYHKEGEEDLPFFYADLQVTEMPLVSFDAASRYLETQINNLVNFGNEQFIGQLSMCLYDENDELITAFGDVHKVNNPINHYQMLVKTMDFTGNLPEETEDGHYSVCIAAKQTGCQGWSPLRGCVISGSSIMDRNIDLHYEFIVMNGKMYKLETDGLMTPVDNTEQGPIYDLNGIRVQKATKGGIYIIGGKKVVK